MNIRVKFLITGDDEAQTLYEKMKHVLRGQYAHHLNNVISVNVTGPSVIDEGEFPVVPVILNIEADEYATLHTVVQDISTGFRMIADQMFDLENYYIGIQEVVIDGVMLTVTNTFRLDRYCPEILRPINRITPNTIQEPSWDDYTLDLSQLWNSPSGFSLPDELELIEI